MPIFVSRLVGLGVREEKLSHSSSGEDTNNTVTMSAASGKKRVNFEDNFTAWDINQGRRRVKQEDKSPFYTVRRPKRIRNKYYKMMFRFMLSNGGLLVLAILYSAMGNEGMRFFSYWTGNSSLLIYYTGARILMLLEVPQEELRKADKVETWYTDAARCLFKPEFLRFQVATGQRWMNLCVT